MKIFTLDQHEYFRNGVGRTDADGNKLTRLQCKIDDIRIAIGRRWLYRKMWKVPFRSAYCTTFTGMVKWALWCHFVIKVWPDAHDYSTDVFMETYLRKPEMFFDQHRGGIVRAIHHREQTRRGLKKNFPYLFGKDCATGKFGITEEVFTAVQRSLREVGIDVKPGNEIELPSGIYVKET